MIKHLIISKIELKICARHNIGRLTGLARAALGRKVMDMKARILLVLAALLIGLSACAGSPQDVSGTTAPTDASSSATTAPTTGDTSYSGTVTTPETTKTTTTTTTEGEEPSPISDYIPSEESIREVFNLNKPEAEIILIPGIEKVGLSVPASFHAYIFYTTDGTDIKIDCYDYATGECLQENLLGDYIGNLRIYGAAIDRYYSEVWVYYMWNESDRLTEERFARDYYPWRVRLYRKDGEVKADFEQKIPATSIVKKHPELSVYFASVSDRRERLSTFSFSFVKARRLP